MERKEIFKNYLSTGFQKCNERIGSFEEMATVYDLNYGKILPPVSSNPKILDIGCGMGHFLYYCNQKGYKDFIGIDISKEAVEYCKEHITNNVELIEDLNQFLSKNPCIYDVVVMNDVIEHIPKKDILEILKQIRKALKENGLIIIKTNNSANILGSQMRDNDFTHEVGFTEFSLTQVLLMTGYTNIQPSAMQYPKAGIKRAIRLLLRRILHSIYRFIYYIEFHEVPNVVSHLIIVTGKK